jgi:hypothetical protein
VSNAADGWNHPLPLPRNNYYTGRGKRNSLKMQLKLTDLNDATETKLL